MSGHEQETDVRDSTPGSTGPERAAGGMGVSSERVGHTGPGQFATDGIKDTSALPPDTPPEERPDGDDEGGAESSDRIRTTEEPQPEGLDPKAGYPSLDPRSKRKPFLPSPDGKHSGSTG